MIQPNQYGLLPEGIHDLTLDEVGELFGRFQRSDRRVTLFKRLQAYVGEVRAIQPALTLHIDGSFIMTSVDEPEDIDLIVVLPGSWNMAAILRPFEYNVISKRMVKKRYRFDVIVAVERTVAEQEAVEFFGQVNRKWIQQFGWPAGMRKGLVRLR